MDDVEALRARLDALGDIGLEGPGAAAAVAELDAVADAVEGALQEGLPQDPETSVRSGG